MNLDFLKPHQSAWRFVDGELTNCTAGSTESQPTTELYPWSVSKVCPPCNNELKADNIIEHYCASDFVLKMKIKEAKKEKSDRKLIAAQKKKKVLKQGMLRKKDLKKLTLYIKNGANCPCSQLENLGSNFLIMGRKVDQQLLLMSIYKWDKKSKELKFAIKSMKTKQCSYVED